MKNLLIKFPLMVFLAAFIGTVTGCDNPINQGGDDLSSFSVTFKEVGPGYVDLAVTSKLSFEAAYSLGTKKREISSPSILFATGKKITIAPDEVLRINADIQETTTYYLYIAAKLNAESYSEIFEIEFTTPEFEFAGLLNVVGVDYDGYKMQISVPSEVKAGKHAIRYNQCDLMMYNYQTKLGGNDDYFTLLYNAGAYVQKDTILTYSESINWEEAGVDINEDGVVDENDISIRWNPISPGEPVVFVAGEFDYMEVPSDWSSDKNYNVNGFDYPAGWDPGYYLPCVDAEKYWNFYGKNISTKTMNTFEADVKDDIDGFWTGEFQRKIFTVQKPELLDAGIKIEAVDIGPVNATVVFTPEKGVEQYAYGIFDDAALNQMLELCDGKEEFLQWAVTSYFGFYSFGTGVAAGNAELPLTDIFYDVPSESNIHVLVTCMGDSNGTKQSFSRYTFQTTAKVMDAPEIVVTALEDESTPFLAKFNVKCTTWNDPKRGPVTQCYYGANYKKDFILEANRSGNSYYSLAQSQAFTPAEIAEINSDAGLTFSIYTIDGATTRLAVVGFNKENTPNNFNYKDILECPAVADCTTPYREDKPYVKSDLYKSLPGEWTATATLTNGSQYSSKIRISSKLQEGIHYPSELPDSVYTIYSEEADYERNEVDGMFEEFKTQSGIFNKNRLEYQNSLLIEGWIDEDEYNRLDYQTPWDLFISRDYNGVDVKSMFSDFGPKNYLEISEGDKLSITGDMYYTPPVSYTSIPYYLAGYCPQRTAQEGNMVFYDVNSEEYQPLVFPVELSEDGNRLTIKAIEMKSGNKSYTWYPNLVGYDSTQGYMTGQMVVSDIVLERGWNQTRTAAAKTKAGAVQFNRPDSDVVPETVKQMTRFRKPVERKVLKGQVTTGKMVEERLRKLDEALKNQNK